MTEIKAELVKNSKEIIEMLHYWMPDKVYIGGIENGYLTENGEAILKAREKIISLLPKE